MAVTLNRLIEMMARSSGLFISSTVTTGVATTTLGDTTLTHDINTLYNKWVYIAAAATQPDIVGQARRITTIAGTTLTVAPAFSETTTIGDTFYILPYNPDVYRDALQEAARTLADVLWLPVRDESIIVDNLIATNPGFETAVGAGGNSPGWIKVDSPTLTDETTIRIHGTNSLKFVASGLDQIYQEIDGNMDMKEIVGKTVTFRAWVFAEDASAVRIGISFDGGSSFTYSDYHDGKDHWQDLEAKADVPADWTSVRVYLGGTNTTCYFDLARAWVDPISLYSMPSTVPYPGPNRLFIQADINRPEGPYDIYPSSCNPSGRILRIESMGIATPPTSSSSIELSEVRAELLIAQASVFMFQTLQNLDSGNSRQHKSSVETYRERVFLMRNSARHRMRYMGAHDRFLWNTLEDGETRYLKLER